MIAGFAYVSMYDARPGEAGAPPPVWPAAAIPAVAGPMLIMALHPRCPCSRASVAELEELLARASSRPAVHLLFVRPAGAPAGWTDGPLWSAAGRIAGARRRVDEQGRLAAAFGLRSSGHALLYDGRGRLAFSGGVTVSAGHRGLSDGGRALLALLKGEQPGRRTFHVFGCLLSGDGGGENGRSG